MQHTPLVFNPTQQTRNAFETLVQIELDMLKAIMGRKLAARALLAPDATWTPDVPVGGESRRRLGAEIALVQGHKLYLEQPYVFWARAGQGVPCDGLVQTVYGTLYFNYTNVETVFEEVLTTLLMPKLCPSHEVPEDDDPDAFERRAQMDFDELKAKLERLLREYGYAHAYEMGDDLQISTHASEPKRFAVRVTLTGSGTGSIRMEQPHVLWHRAGPIVMDGYLATPYMRRTFNRGNVEQVFALVLKAFVEREAPDYEAKQAQRARARVAVRESVLQPDMDALLVAALRRARETLETRFPDVAFDLKDLCNELHASAVEKVALSSAWKTE